MKLQKLLSLVRQAVDKYNMIEENDHIAVGISGGKDSLTLLYALAKLREFYPRKFTLSAITVNLGYSEFDTTNLKVLCDQLNVPYYVENTEIAKIVFDVRKEKNPCSLCSKMRKGALNEKALILGCNKIAYAHHKDDAIDTLFLSMFYESRLETFEPVTNLDKTGLQLIRPLIYVNEADVIGFKNKYNLPVVSNPCPADGFTKREYIKNHVAALNKELPGVKQRIFTAIEEKLY